MPIFRAEIPLGRVKCYNGRSAVFLAPKDRAGIYRLTAIGRAAASSAAPRF